MAEVFLATSWGWAASAADINSEAIAVTIGGASGIDTTDASPQNVGGRRMIVGTQAERSVRLPCPDPGSHYFLHLYLQRTGGVLTGTGSGGGIGVSDAASQLGVNISRVTNANNWIVRNNTTTLFAVTGVLTSDLNHLILEVVEHGSEGIVRIWVNGVLHTEQTGLNTSRGWTADRLTLASPGQSGGVATTQFAHVILSDTFLGPQAVVHYRGMATDEALNQWTRNTGSTDAEAIGEAPNDGDTSYLRSEDDGEATRHRIGSVDPSVGAIVARRRIVMVRTEGPGGDRIQVTSQSGTGDPDTEILESFAPSYTLRGTSYVSEDPDTEGSWTPAALMAEEHEIVHLEPA